MDTTSAGEHARDGKWPDVSAAGEERASAAPDGRYVTHMDARGNKDMGRDEDLVLTFDNRAADGETCRKAGAAHHPAGSSVRSFLTLAERLGEYTCLEGGHRW